MNAGRTPIESRTSRAQGREAGSADRREPGNLGPNRTGDDEEQDEKTSINGPHRFRRAGVLAARQRRPLSGPMLRQSHLDSARLFVAVEARSRVVAHVDPSDGILCGDLLLNGLLQPLTKVDEFQAVGRLPPSADSRQPERRQGVRCHAAQTRQLPRRPAPVAATAQPQSRRRRLLEVRPHYAGRAALDTA